MAKLKVFSGRHQGWSWDSQGNAKSGRDVLIATTSQKKVCEKLIIGIREVRDHWSLTRNEEDIELALKHPEKVIFFRSDYYRDREIVDIADDIEDNRKRNAPKKEKH